MSHKVACAALWVLSLLAPVMSHSAATGGGFDGSATLVAPRSSSGGRFELSARLLPAAPAVAPRPADGRFDGSASLAPKAAQAACGAPGDTIHINGFE